jgi:plastocyanin
MKKALAVAAVVLIAASGLAACSSDDSDDSSSGSSSDKAPVSLDGKVNDEGRKDISGDGASPSLELEADDFYFGPTFIQFAAGQKVTIELHNEGGATHTFTAPGADIDEELAPDDTKDVEITLPESGNLEFFCRFHRSQGMQGAFFSS